MSHWLETDVRTLLWPFRPMLYVTLSAERLTVRNLKSGAVVSEVPEMAISAGPNKSILAIGSNARNVAASNRDAQVVNPFGHPRTLVSDFTVGECVLREFVRRVRGNGWLSSAPVIAMHPLGSPQGGFTQVELRAFREMAIGAGAREIALWLGAELTDQEALSKLRQPGRGDVDRQR